MMKSLVLAGARNRRFRPIYSVLRTIITACKIFGIMIASSLMMLGLAFVAWYGGRSIRRA